MRADEFLKEGDVIHSKFQQRLAQKRGMMHNPDAEPPVSRKDGKPFDRFEVKEHPSGKSGTIIGVRVNGYQENVGTTRIDVAQALAGAYNAGGYSTQKIEQVPLRDGAIEIVKEYQEYGSYGGWISDKNEIFGTDTEQAHLDLINDLGFASFERAFEAGWVKMTWKNHGWMLEGMPKDVKRAFHKIGKRFFMEAKNSTENFTLLVDLLLDPMNRYENITSEYFIMPQEKIRLIQYMNGL